MKHNHLYNNLLILSRNIFFYKRLNLPDNFETRIFLIFFHFSIILIIFKQKKEKFNQSHYNYLFHNIENDLREMGYGDISVNKKMKTLNRFFYDILLKLNINIIDGATKLDENLLIKYFRDFKDKNNTNFRHFVEYFTRFYEFCYELSIDNVLQEFKNYKY